MPRAGIRSRPTSGAARRGPMLPVPGQAPNRGRLQFGEVVGVQPVADRKPSPREQQASAKVQTLTKALPGNSSRGRTTVTAAATARPSRPGTCASGRSPQSRSPGCISLPASPRRPTPVRSRDRPHRIDGGVTRGSGTSPHSRARRVAPTGAAVRPATAQRSCTDSCPRLDDLTTRAVARSLPGLVVGAVVEALHRPYEGPNSGPTDSTTSNKLRSSRSVEVLA